MKKTLVFSLLLTVALAWGCKQKQYMVGYYSYEEFQQECKWENFVEEDYKPKDKWMDSLRSLRWDDSLQVQLFLGSYCGDSKKWVPRFYRLKDELPIASIDIISVDTTKKDEKGLWKTVKLEKIPTFIFYQDGKEAGRIVEKPKGRLEKNLFRLFN